MSGEQILTVQQMRDAEQRVFDAGMAEFELMQLAASRAAEWVRRIAAGRSVTILCGPGNNGGDGYVMAHCLAQAGLSVSVVAPQSPKTDAAEKARDLWGRSVLTSGGTAKGEVFVDCLFGSGLTRPLGAADALLLRDLAARHQMTIALDVPSGIESDTGENLNDKLPSNDVTLALGAWKYAHCLLPSRATMGTQRLVPIGVDAVEGAAMRVTKPALCKPALDSHKYRRGFATIVGGEMAGAAMLAAKAAMRAGAGYVKLAGHGAEGGLPDLVLDTSHVRVVLADERINAVLVGPGLMRHEGSVKTLEEVCKRADYESGEEEHELRPRELQSQERGIVLDADALHLIEPWMTDADQSIFATPHDGELDVMCRKYSVIGDNRLARIKALARASSMVICAKGPDTIIADPDGRVAVAPPAPSWLSIAGSGDVLAGIAVSRMASGSDPFQAACEAVWLHGEAARICGPAFTPVELAHAVSTAHARCL